MIKTILRATYADLALMEDALRRTGLDWTVVRPPRLTDGPLTANYRTEYGQNIRGGFLISAPTSPTPCSTRSTAPRPSARSSASPGSWASSAGPESGPVGRGHGCRTPANLGQADLLRERIDGRIGQ
jgi:hypothetical protein